jgi:hypothetical protein
VCPPNFNPADYFIHTLAIVPGDEDACRKRVIELCNAFDESDEGRAMKSLAARGGVEDPSSNKLASIDDDVIVKKGVYKAGWFAQLAAVVWRSFLSVTREPLILKVRLFQTVVRCFIYLLTVRWFNFVRRDPKMGVFLQSTEATPCGHFLK